MSDSSPRSSSSSAPPLPAPVRNAVTPVFVDLWHPRCGACRAVQERLKQLRRRLGDAIAVESINVAAAPEIAETFDVEGVPTVLVFHDDRLRARLVGAETIQSFVDRVVEAIGE